MGDEGSPPGRGRPPTLDYLRAPAVPGPAPGRGFRLAAAGSMAVAATLFWVGLWASGASSLDALLLIAICWLLCSFLAVASTVQWIRGVNLMTFSTCRAPLGDALLIAVPPVLAVGSGVAVTVI